MCLHKLADRLYECLRQQCDTHLAGQLALLRGQLSLEPLAFLHRADETWRDYCDGMLTIRSIFLYLDRTYVLTLPGIKSLFDMGLALLRGHLTGQPEVRCVLALDHWGREDFLCMVETATATAAGPPDGAAGGEQR